MKSEDETREIHLRWFGHVEKRPIDAIVRKIDCLKVTETSSEKGIPKKAWIELVRDNLKAFI